MPRSGSRVDPGLALAVGALLVFGAAFIASTRFDVHGQTYFTLFDDAMVSMTYARNLAAGHGLVWNAGGPAVEGYTNFLWTLWMAVLHVVGIAESNISLAVMISGLAVLVANLVVLWRIARVVSTSVTTARIAVLTASLCYPLLFWTLRGMEVGLMALVVNVAVLAALNPGGPGRVRPGLLIPLAMLPLIRPDGIVPAAIIAAFAGWTALRGGHARVAMTIVASPLLALLAHTGFRWWMYGDVLPNTYYLKVVGIPLIDRVSRGAATLWETIQSNLWLTFAMALLIRVDERVRLIASVVITQVCYSVWVGGDAWEQSHYANRYVAAVLPLAILLAARGVEQLLTPPRSIPRAIIAGVLGQILIVTAIIDGLAPQVFSPTTWTDAMALAGILLKATAGLWFLLVAATTAKSMVVPSLLRPGRMSATVTCALLVTLSGTFVGEWLDGEGLHIKDDARAARLGLELRADTSSDSSIGVVWAGAIPYFAQRQSIDFLGKSDVHVARVPPRRPFVPGHDKWDYDYSVGSERPDVIVQTWRATPADIRQFQSSGYERIGQDAFVRSGAPGLDVGKLTAAFAEFDRTAPANARPQR